MQNSTIFCNNRNLQKYPKYPTIYKYKIQTTIIQIITIKTKTNKINYNFNNNKNIIKM